MSPRLGWNVVRWMQHAFGFIVGFGMGKDGNFCLYFFYFFYIIFYLRVLYS